MYDDLDDWFEAFAKWTLTFDSLFDDVDERAAAREQRKTLCDDGGVVMREWTPVTFKTMANALASWYRQTKPPNAFVISSRKQFPRYNIFSMRRVRGKRAWLV